MYRQYKLFFLILVIYSCNLYSMASKVILNSKEYDQELVKENKLITLSITNLIPDLKKIVLEYLGNLHATLGKTDSQIHFDKHIGCMVYGKDGQIIISGGRDHKIKIWETNTNSLRHVIDETNDGHLADVKALAVSNDNKVFASGSFDKSIKIWDRYTFKCLNTINIDKIYVPVSLAYSPNNKFLATGFNDGSIYVANTENYKFENIFRVGYNLSVRINLLEFSPDNKHLISGLLKKLFIWNTDTYKVIKNFDITNIGEYDCARALNISKDGRFLAYATNYGILIFDLNTLSFLFALSDFIISEPNHLLYIEFLKFSNDNRIINVGLSDGTISQLDINSRKKIRSFNDKEANWIMALQVSPCGKYLASAHCSTIKIWIDFNIFEEEIVREKSCNISDNKKHDCCVIA